MKVEGGEQPKGESFLFHMYFSVLTSLLFCQWVMGLEECVFFVALAGSRTPCLGRFFYPPCHWFSAPKIIPFHLYRLQPVWMSALFAVFICCFTCYHHVLKLINIWNTISTVVWWFTHFLKWKGLLEELLLYPPLRTLPKCKKTKKLWDVSEIIV